MSIRFSGIFFGLIASLAIFFSVQAQAATVYSFDTPVVGTFASGGTVSMTANGSSETFVVTVPTGDTFNEFAINLQWGATVAPSASYTVTPYTAWAYFPGGFGPFNTVLTGNFGNSLTFTVSNYAGIYNLNVNSLPIWFLAASDDERDCHMGGRCRRNCNDPAPRCASAFCRWPWRVWAADLAYET